MTPSAMTAAGRAAPGRTKLANGRPAEAPPAGHRRALRQRPAPHVPRRVSGPARRPRPAAAPQHAATLGMRALAVVRSLPEHSLIDRLVRGRAWIPVLGVLLAGIVAMQVEVLKLGTNLGHWVQRSTALQSQNESLRASVAALNDDQRIERLAAGMGMVMPAATTIAFLSPAPNGQVTRAIANIHAPDPAGFAAQLAAQAAAAAAMNPSPPAATTSTSTSTTPATASGATAPTTVNPSTSSSSSASGTTSTTTAPATGSAGPSGTSGSAGTTQAGTTSAGTTQATASGAAAIAPAASSQSGNAAGG